MNGVRFSVPHACNANKTNKIPQASIGYFEQRMLNVGHSYVLGQVVGVPLSSHDLPFGTF